MKLFRHLYLQVLVAIILGGWLGVANPELGVKLQQLGDGFITRVATLRMISHIPVAGVALLIGVDRFMSEAGR